MESAPKKFKPGTYEGLTDDTDNDGDWGSSPYYCWQKIVIKEDNTFFHEKKYGTKSWTNSGNADYTKCSGTYELGKWDGETEKQHITFKVDGKDLDGTFDGYYGLRIPQLGQEYMKFT